MSTNNFKFAQLQAFILAGSGAVLGATTITLKTMTDIDGNALTMAGTFGTKGFGTMEPGNGTLEEQISFTGLTNNANGTTTLTGVSSVTFTYPYTETSGLLKTHAGSTSFVISNTSGFYNEVLAKNDDATITGKYTFPGGGDANAPVSGASYTAPTDDLEYASKKYVDSVAIAGAPDATLTVKGIVQLATQAQVDAKTATGSTGAALVSTPNEARSTKLSDGIADTGAADAYAIAPSPAISAYVAYQIFTFVAAHTNTTTSTLNVNGLGVKTIKKLDGATNLAAGDIVAGQLVEVEYDGTNFQMTSPSAIAPLTSSSLKFGGTGADGALTITSGTTTIDLGSASVVTKNYTSISITGTGALAFSNPAAGGTLIRLLSQGNVTLTSSATPMIDASGMGAASATTANASLFVVDLTSHIGTAGAIGNTGGSSTGGTAGTAFTTPTAFYTRDANQLNRRAIFLTPGSGGNVGGNSRLGGLTGGPGGRGGGALYIECRGAYNFTTASGISVSGTNGTAGSGSGSGASGGGGGGAAGSFLALYNTLTAASGTVTSSGGNGGAGGKGTDAGGNGGAGGGGAGAWGAGGAGGSGGGNGSAGGAGSAGTTGGGGGGSAGSTDNVAAVAGGAGASDSGAVVSALNIWFV